MEIFKTLGKTVDSEYIEKKSVFIGQSLNVSTEKEALEFVQAIKKKHYDARHNVYAIVLKNGFIKFSDDGEPQGTAGVPILNVIQKNGLCDVVIVVTRYFGGILLGAGGLNRAYTKAAVMTIEASEKKDYYEHTLIDITCDYSDYQKVLYELNKNNLYIDNTAYDNNVTISIAVLSEEAKRIEDSVFQLLNSKVEIKENNKEYRIQKIK